MGKGQAIAGLVLSIIGVVCGFGFLSGWLSVAGLPISIVGLVLSVTGGKKLRANNQPAGIGTAGMVIGIIAVVITTITFFTCGLCTICAAGVEAGIESGLNSLL